MRRCVPVLLCVVLGTASLARGQTKVDFKRDIQPIFEDRCYECHGAKKQKSGVRFDRKATVFKGGDSGKPAVVAGQSTNSPLIQKVTSTDPDELMPPKGDKLTDAQVDRSGRALAG